MAINFRLQGEGATDRAASVAILAQASFAQSSLIHSSFEVVFAPAVFVAVHLLLLGWLLRLALQCILGFFVLGTGRAFARSA